MVRVRKDVRMALIEKYDSQIVASRRLKIPENKLSYIVQGHSEPNERERKILKKALGRDFFAEDKERDHAATNVSRGRGVLELLADETGSVMTIAGAPEKDSKADLEK